MKSGRKPKHAFHSLLKGQRVALTGKAKIYPYQFINQFNKTEGRKERLRVVKYGNEVFAERIL